MITPLPQARILAIQSHVVTGYVGNRMAVFPLQVHGLEVDVINTTQFSNHRGYPYCYGQTYASDVISDLFKGLYKQGLHKQYTHILTGYVGSCDVLVVIHDFIQKVKQHNADLIYVCDPVMGDAGRLYVDPAVLPIYRDLLLPLSTCITPNQWETELLTGICIKNEVNLQQAVDTLHAKGIPIVVVSSYQLQPCDGLCYALGSRQAATQREQVRCFFPALEAHFVGTGDLFTALLLAWLHKSGADLLWAMEHTLATIQDILTDTYRYAVEEVDARLPGIGPIALAKQRLKNKFLSPLSLRLIQNRESILTPKTHIQSTVERIAIT